MRARPRPRGLGALTLAAVLLAAACSDSGSTGGSDSTPTVDRGAIIAGIVDDVVLPRYADAAATADSAARSVSEYCRSATNRTGALGDADLGEARASVATALEAWYRLDAVDFGPAMDLRAEAQIAYPPDAEKIAELVSDGTAPRTVADANQRTASDARGFGTVAVLLAGAGGDDGELDARCAYATVVAQNAAQVAAAVEADWAGGYAARAAGRGSDAIPHKEVLDIIVNMTIDAFASDARAGADDAVPTDAFLQAVVAHADTAFAIWGTPAAPRLRAAVDGDLADQVTDELAAVRDGASGGDAAATVAAVDAARATIGTEVVAALDVVVGFSENDGDS